MVRGSTPRWRRRAGTRGSGASRTWGRRTGRSSTTSHRRRRPPRRRLVPARCGTATRFGWGNAPTPPPCTWASTPRSAHSAVAAVHPRVALRSASREPRASRRGWKIASLAESPASTATRRLRSSRCSTDTAATRRRARASHLPRGGGAASRGKRPRAGGRGGGAGARSGDGRDDGVRVRGARAAATLVWRCVETGRRARRRRTSGTAGCPWRIRTGRRNGAFLRARTS